MNKIEPISFSRAVDVPKGWGKEVHIVNNMVLPGQTFPTGYSGKLLSYTKEGAISSMHYHMIKHETFYVLAGSFVLNYYGLGLADSYSKMLFPGDIVVIPPGNPHQIICREFNSVIIEFATTDYSFDNYRIIKGDSQTSSK